MKTETIKLERNYGIDALRMLSMYMVLLLHVLRSGGILDKTTTLGVQYEVAWFIEVGAFVGVDCFALISGYVGINSKGRYSNIVYLWLTTIFYTVGINILFWIADPSSISMHDWRVVIFPVMEGYYWYLTCYIAMYLFIPIINLSINRLNKLQLQKILGVSFVVFSVLPTVFRLDPFSLKTGYSPLWLIILYIFGAYIKKYGMLEKCTKKVFLAGYIFLTCITWLSKLVIQVGTKMIGIEGKNGENLIIYTSPTILLASLCLLLAFERWNVSVRAKKVISFLSPMAFSVYLIHRQPLVWNRIWFHRFEDIALLPWYAEIIAILTVALIAYLVCSFIDLGRIKLFEKLKIKRKIETLEENLNQMIEKKLGERVE